MSKINNASGSAVISAISTFLISYWILFIFSDFTVNSTDYISALSFFKYTDFLITYALTGLAGIYLLSKKPFRSGSHDLAAFRPVYGYLFLLLTMTILMGFLLSKSGIEGSIPGFLGKTVLIHSSVFAVLCSAYAGGAFILSRLNIRSAAAAVNLIISLALGLALLTLGFFFIAALKILTPVSITVWLLLFPLPGWKFLPDLFRRMVRKSSAPVTVKTSSLILLLAVNLLVAINLLAVATPIPLGYDALTLYMNIPKLMSEYGGLVQGYQPHYWSVLVSIGYALFESNITAQYLGILPGILSIFILYHLARLFVSRDLAIFSAAGFYFIPVILWQSSYEVKTDLGMLFFFLSALLLVFSFWREEKKPEMQAGQKLLLPENTIKIWALAGIFAGFALGIKLTTLIAIYTLVITICYRYGGKFLGIGAFFLCLSSVFILKLYTFSNFEFTFLERMLLSASLAGVSFIFLLFGSIKARENLLHPLKISLVFVVFTVFMTLPWAIKNSLEHGKISLSAMVTGKDPKPRLLGENDTSPPPSFKPVLMGHTPYDTAGKNPAEAVFVNQQGDITGKKEEINRYLGYENGFLRFLSLPYDLTMKKNVNLFSTDIGLLFLGLLPLFFLGMAKGPVFLFALRAIFLFVWLGFSIITVYNPDTVLSSSEIIASIKSMHGASGTLPGLISSLHIALITPLLYLAGALSPLYSMLALNSEVASVFYIILFIVILFFLSRPLLSREDKFSKSFFLLSGVYFFLWLILSSGIPWYGIGGLSLLPLFMAKYIFSDKENLAGSGRATYYLCSGMVAVWLVLLLPFKLTPLAGTKTQEPEKLDYRKVFSGSSLLYACNQKSWNESMNDYLNPQTREIIRILNNDEDAVILNIGSMMRFFIVKNDIRLIDDNQLDFFYTIWNAAGKSKIATGNRLKLLDVKYILLDLGVHTMDMTKDGSLLRKVEELVTYLHQNEKTELLTTDRLVIHPLGDRQMEINGAMVKVKNDIFGNGIIESGKLALFQIK